MGVGGGRQAGRAQCAVMSTPKPGQIRCPTCLRSTPPAAFCTQCGSPIPPSARVRPRGLDREELDERIRTRPPGDPAFRRGTAAEDAELHAAGGAIGYRPFEPEPEDRLAVREPDAPTPRVDRMEDPGSSDAEWPREDVTPPPAAYVPPPPVEEPQYTEPPQDEVPQYAEPPQDEEPQYAERPHYAEQPPYADEPYLDAQQYDEEAYPSPYTRGQERGGGGGALPIIGFVVLCVLAMAVGAVLAGLLGGEDPVGGASPTPTQDATQEPSVAASEEATPAPSTAGSATAEPSDGPVTFPDGAIYTMQPCATYEAGFDGCTVDGSSLDTGDVWVWVGFDDGRGADGLTLSLVSAGETIDQQERQLGEIIACGGTCSGYIWGAIYRDLLPGDYELVLRRNGEFADRAPFTVAE